MNSSDITGTAHVHKRGGRAIAAEIITDGVCISSVQDALDLMADIRYHCSCDSIIAARKHFSPDFFDLKTGLAGVILQKFSNYGMKLAIIGDFSNEKSQSLQAFIRESNSCGRILFCEQIDRALDVFSGSRV